MMAAESVPDPESPCALLSLPKELRLEIYEFAYAVDVNESDWIELTDATPPNKSLLLTCKQLHVEAHDLYVAAHRDYWSRVKISLDARDGGETTFERLNRAVLEHESGVAHAENMRILTRQKLNIDTTALYCGWIKILFDNSPEYWDHRRDRRAMPGKERRERVELRWDGTEEDLWKAGTLSLLGRACGMFDKCKPLKFPANFVRFDAPPGTYRDRDE